LSAGQLNTPVNFGSELSLLSCHFSVGVNTEEAPKVKVHNARAKKKDFDKRCQINGLERIIIKSKKTQKQANNELAYN
jgi:hypothetical protein